MKRITLLMVMLGVVSLFFLSGCTKIYEKKAGVINRKEWKEEETTIVTEDEEEYLITHPEEYILYVKYEEKNGMVKSYHYFVSKSIYDQVKEGETYLFNEYKDRLEELPSKKEKITEETEETTEEETEEATTKEDLEQSEKLTTVEETTEESTTEIEKTTKVEEVIESGLVGEIGFHRRVTESNSIAERVSEEIESLGNVIEKEELTTVEETAEENSEESEEELSVGESIIFIIIIILLVAFIIVVSYFLF